MGTTRIQPERIRRLNRKPVRAGSYVLYWMQASQRAEHNHALELAVQHANALSQPVRVVFGLMDDYPEANRRHYRFMLEGLRDARSALAARGIRMSVVRGHPAEAALGYARAASLLVCDRGYLRHQRAWRAHVAEHAPGAVLEVESDLVVPVEVASNKAEYAARTLRPKIHRHLERFLVALRATPVRRDAMSLPDDGLDLHDLDATLAALRLEGGVAPVPHLFRGGARAARRALRRFVRERLPRYRAHRARPETDDVSYMSMYLHFGHVSPLHIALSVRAARAPCAESKEAYLEELLVRRELAANFCHYRRRDYDRYAGLPRWARSTLAAHARDPRPHRYGAAELEASATHDPYWNAAMDEMRHTGYMHNHMRMYWGKKILEWSGSPAQAYRVALGLNNKYFLDGRDPSSYANVGWIFGLHDRPWAERPIFGTVRYMAASGLERKCDIGAYVEKVQRLRRRAQ